MPTLSKIVMVLSVRALPVVLAAGSSLLAVPPAHGAPITWTAAVNGQWKDDGKWTPNGAPNSDTADATIAKAATVTMNGEVTVNTLTLDDPGAKLVGNGTLKMKDTTLLKQGNILWKDSTFEGIGANRKVEVRDAGTLDLVSTNKFVKSYLFSLGTTNIKAVKIGTNNVPAKVDMDNSFNNYGPLTFTSEVPGDVELNFATGKQLVNGNGGDVKFEAGMGGKRTINGGVLNYRLMSFNTPTTINGPFENRAVIDYDGNKVSVNADTTVGTADSTSSNAGVIEIAKDKRLIVKGKLNNLAAVASPTNNPEGVIRGAGTLVMPNDKLSDKGKITCKRAQSLFAMTGDTGTPGEPDPVLTIEGDYEKSGGTLEVAITGLSSYSYEVPRIDVQGHAEILGGDLAVLFAGPLPGLGAKFCVMTSSQPVSGAFASSTVQAGDVVFGVHYNDPDNLFNPCNVTLEVLSVPAPGTAMLMGLAGCLAVSRRRSA